MTRVSWDAVPLPVRQFLETHANGSDGVAIVNEGRTKYRLLPVVDDIPWNEDSNRRRFELIDREIAGTISPEESLELERLQMDFRRFRHRVAPLPLAETRELLESLERKAAASAP